MVSGTGNQPQRSTSVSTLEAATADPLLADPFRCGEGSVTDVLADRDLRQRVGRCVTENPPATCADHVGRPAKWRAIVECNHLLPFEMPVCGVCAQMLLRRCGMWGLTWNKVSGIPLECTDPIQLRLETLQAQPARAPRVIDAPLPEPT